MTAPDELRLRAEAVEWRQVEGEVVALDVGSAEYLTTNPAGVCLWTELAEGTDRERLAQTLVDRFGIEPATATADVERFLDALRGRGLLAE